MVVGVLVVSRPTLNGAWRELAWPGRYSGDRREGARRLNAEVRAISRVIVRPEFRGRGIARRLVRAYLDRPLTPATEAPTSRGRSCPFFVAAGMTEYRLPAPAWDTRLMDALAAGAEVERELPRWAGAARATRAWAGAPVEQIAALARDRLGGGRVAYAAVYRTRRRPRGRTTCPAA
jgi:predicted GNAT family acetyltransferase